MRKPLAGELIVVVSSEAQNAWQKNQRRKTIAQFASIYTWLSWGKYDNRYSNFPKTNTDYMNVYNDNYFKTHTWLWDGKPHWAYNTQYMNRVGDRKAIEWTPNTIRSKVVIVKDKANVELTSVTPNFKTYQVKILPGRDWTDVPDNVKLKLTKDKNEFIFRSVNLAGVTGPEHKLIIQAKQ